MSANKNVVIMTIHVFILTTVTLITNKSRFSMQFILWIDSVIRDTLDTLLVKRLQKYARPYINMLTLHHNPGTDCVKRTKKQNTFS